MIRKIYNDNIVFLMIIISLLPLMFATEIYNYYVYIFLFIYFISEFLYNLVNKNEHKLFLVIDLLSTISLLTPLHSFIALRFIRVFKLIIRSSSFRIIYLVIKQQSEMLIITLKITLVYIFITAILMFNIEPNTFDNEFMKAFYFSTISLTTVGFGDITPITNLGQLITSISTIFGIGIIALPTGIIASQFMHYYHEVVKKYTLSPVIIFNLSQDHDNIINKLKRKDYFDITLFNELESQINKLSTTHLTEDDVERIVKLLTKILFYIFDNQDKDSSYLIVNDDDFSGQQIIKRINHMIKNTINKSI